MTQFTPEQEAAIRKVITDEVARVRAELVPTGPTWSDWLRGALASWTVWAGGLLLVLPELLDAVAPIITETWGADAWRRVVQIAGVVMILLRAKTTVPLPERGVKA